MLSSKTAFACLPVCAMAIGLSSALANEVEIIDATAKKSANGWTFSVTLKHEDSGWDHYANLWQVLSPEGDLLGERVLLHPHVNEQPFTRSLSGVDLPSGLSEVIIRAHDTVHGQSAQEYKLSLPQ